MDDVSSSHDDPYHPSRISVQARLDPLPTTEFIQPCTRIEPEASDGSAILLSIADLYQALTHFLPLAGAVPLNKGRDGEISLTRHLHDEAPWLSAAIDRIDAQLRLQLWAGRPWIAFRPLLLVGPPGSGKSHLARLIADKAGTGHAVLDFAGISDSRTIEGTARGWTSAQPCFPAVAITQARTANPVVVLEEIDKAGGSARSGDPLSVILTMIERSTARAYYDKCLLAPIDLSHVNWIMTANDASRLPVPLRSRLNIVEVQGPRPEHFDRLLANLLRDLADRWGLPVGCLPDLGPEGEAMLAQRFERHRSVRRLAREIETILAAVIRIEPRRPH